MINLCFVEGKNNYVLRNESKYKDLDKLSTKKCLSEKFGRMRIKNLLGIIPHNILDLLLVYVFSCMLIYLSIIMTGFSEIHIVDNLINNICLFALFVALPFVINHYYTKITKNYKNVFNNINEKLGDDALTSKTDDLAKEIKEINCLIEKKDK